MGIRYVVYLLVPKLGLGDEKRHDQKPDYLQQTRATTMANLIFSVPDEISEAFNHAFENMDRNEVVANLMRKAIAEMQQQTQRQAAFQRLTERRINRPHLSDDEIRAARTESRE